MQLNQPLYWFQYFGESVEYLLDNLAIPKKMAVRWSLFTRSHTHGTDLQSC